MRALPVVAFAVLFLLTVPAAGQVEVARSPVSVQVSPGGEVLFSLFVSVEGDQKGIVVTEVLPAGWSLAGADPDPDKTVGNEVKWLFTSQSGVENQSISYTLAVPSSAGGSHQVAGSWKAVQGDGMRLSGETESSTIIVLGGNGTGGQSGQAGAGGFAPPGNQTNGPAQAAEGEERCAPGSRRCEGDAALTCSAQGVWIREDCRNGCREGACLEEEERELPLVQAPGFPLTGQVLGDNAPLLGGMAALAILVIGMLYRLRKKRRSRQEVGASRYEFLPQPGSA